MFSCSCMVSRVRAHIRVLGRVCNWRIDTLTAS